LASFHDLSLHQLHRLFFFKGASGPSTRYSENLWISSSLFNLSVHFLDLSLTFFWNISFQPFGGFFEQESLLFESEIVDDTYCIECEYGEKGTISPSQNYMKLNLPSLPSNSKVQFILLLHFQCPTTQNPYDCTDCCLSLENL